MYIKVSNTALYKGKRGPMTTGIYVIHLLSTSLRYLVLLPEVPK